MVEGLSIFREAFKGLEDSYVIIGGVACEQWVTQAGQPFRPTKDFDLVILVNDGSPAFYEKLWNFIKAGQYQHRQQSTQKAQAYRFKEPLSEGYPSIIELFSQNVLGLPTGIHLTPIPTPDDLSSLSAILLDEDCFEFVSTARIKDNGLSLAPPHCLIPLKARAWLNLTEERKKDANAVDERKIKKHRNDVFQLFKLLTPTDRFDIPDTLKSDLSKFLTFFSDDSSEWVGIHASLGTFGLKDKSLVVRLIKEIFQLAGA